MHVGAKAPEIRRGLARRGTPGAAAGLTAEQAAERAAVDDAAETGAVPRRAFVVAAGLGVGAVTLTTVGQTFSPLGQVSLLAPRSRASGRRRCRCDRPPGPRASPTSARSTDW